MSQTSIDITKNLQEFVFYDETHYSHIFASDLSEALAIYSKTFNTDLIIYSINRTANEKLYRIFKVIWDTH